MSCNRSIGEKFWKIIFFWQQSITRRFAPSILYIFFPYSIIILVLLCFSLFALLMHSCSLLDFVDSSPPPPPLHSWCPHISICWFYRNHLCFTFYVISDKVRSISVIDEWWVTTRTHTMQHFNADDPPLFSNIYENMLNFLSISV